VFDEENSNQSATGEHLYKCITESFAKQKVPQQNVIGFGSDGCSVMMGINNSVASRFKKDYPGIFVMKCICHSAHLCASEACKQLPKSCEELARGIFNFLHSSAKRQNALMQFQKFLDLKPHKILHPSQTRWLSLEAVSKRIIEQWDALRLYFTDTYLEQKLHTTEFIFNSLNDPFMKLHFYFLSWILPKFTELNKYFQTERVVITDIHEKIRLLYTTILLSFMKRDYVLRTDLSSIQPNNGQHHIFDSQMYLGVMVQEHINKNNLIKNKEKLKYFYNHCRQFLQTSAIEIKKRYDMNDQVLSKISILSAKNSLSNAFRDENPSILPLVTYMKRAVPIKENEDYNEIIQKLDDQWRALPMSLHLLPESITKLQYSNDDPDVLW